MGSLAILIRHDLKHLFRRVTNPLLLGSLVLILVTFALTLGTFHYFASVYAPLHGVSNPKFGLGGYEPLLFYLCVVVGLIFALRLPHYRDELSSNVVISYRSPSNFLLALARALTPTLLVFGVVVATAIVYQIFAAVDVAIRPGIVELLETQSLVFVLINLLTTMFFWTSLATLIAQVYRSAAIGFVGAFVLLIVQAFVSPLLPGELGSFTFGYGAANLYVSDLSPDYWDIRHFAYFLSIPALAFALIYATATFHDRTDTSKRTTYIPLIITLTAICVVCQAIVHSVNLLSFNRHQSWLQAYEETVRTFDSQAMVTAIDGQVKIQPGSRLDLDLTYTIELGSESDTSDSTGESTTVAFALNPGMTVNDVLCSNLPMPHTHINGIFKIDLKSCNSTNGHEFALEIVASGNPKPYFLVQHIPRNGDSNVDPQMVRLMGQRSSIFTSDYVALTPLSHWYPQPIGSTSNAGGQNKASLVDVSLTINLRPRSWTLLGPGGQVFGPQDNRHDEVLVEGKFQSLSLLAADFRTNNTATESIDVNVLVHKRHAKRLDRNSLLTDGLVSNVSEAMSKLQSYDIDYPFDQLSIVEVPATLSLLNYTNDVNVGVQSIAMFRESGAPFARVFRMEDMLEQAGSGELPMSTFLRDQVDYMKSDYWTNPILNYTYEDAIVTSLLAGRINRTEENSDLAELVLQTLLFNLLDSPNYRFDFDLANSLVPASRVNFRYIWFHRHAATRLDLRDFRSSLLNSNAFWESIEDSFVHAETNSDQSDVQESPNPLRKQRFRVLKLSELLAQTFKEDAIATTLTNILNEEAAESIDLESIATTANLSNVELAPLIEDLLLNSKLPGINFSVASQLELEETNEYGQNFNTVLNLRNNRDSVGYVSFEVHESQEVVVEDRVLRAIVNVVNLGPFKLKENSSYRLVLNTENAIGSLEANTFLSLNRGKVPVSVAVAPSTQEEILFDDAPNNWFSFQPSQWNSVQNENEIIVDDLDPGFHISPTNYRKQSNLLRFNTGMFRYYYPREEGMDSGLPIGHNPSGPWFRSSRLACWGNYRHTYVVADTSKPGIHKISFNSELPKEGRWSLSYHQPNYHYFLGFQQLRVGNYDIRVEVGDQDWDLNISEEKWVVGWNSIATLDIESPGKARVAVSNKSNGPYVFADAIKWTFVDSQ